MYITIIAYNNNSGLEKDRIIVTDILEENGFQVESRDPFNEFSPLNDSSQLSIFLEYYDKRYLGRKNILVPNQEWFFKDWFPDIGKFDAIFCKTIYSYNIFRKYHSNVIYIGFSSLDYYDETIGKKLICFHANGKSYAKGTKFVLDAWQTEGLPALHLVSSTFIPNSTNKSPIYHYKYLETQYYRIIMNQCLIHIFPSQVEGFGHCINESKSCGSVIITTNYPPMNEHVKKFLIPPNVKIIKSDSLGEVVGINSVDIAKTLWEVLKREDLIEIGKENRSSYLINDKLFKERFLHSLKMI